MAGKASEEGRGRRPPIASRVLHPIVNGCDLLVSIVTPGARCRLRSNWFYCVSLRNGIQEVTGSIPVSSTQNWSSALVNVLWGLTNLVIGYLLLARVGIFELRRWRHVIVTEVGALLMAVMLRRGFGRFYGGL